MHISPKHYNMFYVLNVQVLSTHYMYIRTFHIAYNFDSINLQSSLKSQNLYNKIIRTHSASLSYQKIDIELL